MEDAKRIVEALIDGDATKIQEAILCALNNRRNSVVESYKQIFAEEILDIDFIDEDEDLDEVAKTDGGQRRARVNRIRGGVVQRRKVVTKKSGYKVQNGKVERMSPTERRRRKLAQMKAARKRRGTMKRSLRKRARSNRIRKSRGL
jgi:hypothetical protein